MWESIAALSKRLDSFYPGLLSDNTRFGAAFGSPLYLHLSRKNKVAQAVSLLRAEQTGLWHIFADGSERERLKPEQAPDFDGDELVQLVSALKEDDTAWTKWFAQQEIEPLRLTYEALSAEPQSVLASVLSFLRLDPAAARTVEPRSAKLANSESRQWITRFQAEQSDQNSSA